MTNHRQYGIYLVPPPDLMYPLSLAHQVFATEFGAQIAGGFMVHATIKGFTKLRDGAQPEDFLPALDAYLGQAVQFPALIEPPVVFRDHSLLLPLTRTEALQRFHRDIFDIVAPYIADDCPFSHVEPSRDRFWPHITLVQQGLGADAALRAQAAALGRHIYAQLPRHEFAAESMQLIEFEAADWRGRWWETFRYRQLRGWQLATP